jgi:hypothetical protein
MAGIEISPLVVDETVIQTASDELSKPFPSTSLRPKRKYSIKRVGYEKLHISDVPRTLPSYSNAVLLILIRDPVLLCFFSPWIRDGKKPDPR